MLGQTKTGGCNDWSKRASVDIEINDAWLGMIIELHFIRKKKNGIQKLQSETLSID